MMRYFEITEESPAYVPSKEYWGENKKWVDSTKEGELHDLLKPIIGDTGEYLMDPTRLRVIGELPEDLRPFFIASKTGWKAKVASRLNKDYVALTKKLDLKPLSYREVMRKLGVRFQCGRLTIYDPMGGKYYIETEREIENMTGLKELTEAKFLRIRADWLDKQKNEQ